MLEIANINYGNGSSYSVIYTEELPFEFDFDNPEECAKEIFAKMSNFSGGSQFMIARFKFGRIEKLLTLLGKAFMSITEVMDPNFLSKKYLKKKRIKL